MKRKKIKVCLMLFCIVVVFITMQLNSSNGKAYAKENTITILFTNDMHDHLIPFKVEQNGKISELGGYARLQSAINEEKKEHTNSILVDAGDFSMGTLFQTIYSSDAPELRIMGKMGYDVTTFGNHEFDFRSKGLAESLNVAVKSGDKIPEIVQSNIEFPKDSNGNLTKSLAYLSEAMKNYGVKDYTVIQRGKIKIGVFGIMGQDSASNAPMSGVKFTDVVKNAKAVVKLLKEKEKVDLVICLSHSGVDEDNSKSEDEILAKKIPDIDVIISGHTHTKLTEPITIGNTIIGSCGEFGEYLGVIKISKDIRKGWKLQQYKLREINSSLPEENNISNTVHEFKTLVQEKYLNKFKMKFDQVLAHTSFNLPSPSNEGNKSGEEPLGNLISDAYVYAVKKVEGANYSPIAVAISPSGTIRGSFVKGDVTVADVFNVNSLGIGKDGTSGYPLVSAYLTGKELKTICEVDASISPIMKEAQLYMAGIHYTFNPNRLIFNKVIDVNLVKEDGSFQQIDDKKLYRVVAGLYSVQMLSVVNKKSFNLLSIVPKTKEGKPITNFEDHIITDNSSGIKSEIKEWVAIADYIKSFNKVQGIPQIPNYYSETQGRKIVDNSHNLFQLLKQPNNIALGFYIIITILGVVVVFLLRFLLKKIH